MRTKIISAFPGSGKSVFHKKNELTTLDSDSSGYSWVKGINGNLYRNDNFPQNYIDHIKENIGKYEFIFVSSHKEVRTALLDNNIFHYVVYPDITRKDEFIKRYRERGNDDPFIQLVTKNWNDWQNEMLSLDDGCKLIYMYAPDNLEDVLMKELT